MPRPNFSQAIARAMRDVDDARTLIAPLRFRP
jgi:hypothetical protein